MAESGDDSRFQRLDDALARLSGRVDTLERLLAPPATTPPASVATPAALPASTRPAPSGFMSTALMFAGRTAIILGGAYFLRALTEAGGVARNVGVGLGFAYAGAWLGVADRDAIRRPSSSVVHGLTALLIGVPLLWEASTRFAVLTPWSSLTALATLALAALVVAAHRVLPILAAAATSGAVVTAIALAMTSGSTWPAALVLAALGLASWWIAERAGWSWLPWIPGLAAALMAWLLVLRSSSGASAAERAGAAWVTVAVLVAGYLGSFAWRTLVTRRAPRAFEIVESALIVVVGVVGVVALPASAPALRVTGAGLTLMGILSYAGARAIVPAAAAGGRYAGTVALAFMVAGGYCLFSATWLNAWWLVLGTACFVGSRTFLPVLETHGAFFAVIAAWKIGLVQYAATTWIARGAVSSPALLWPTLAVVTLGLILTPPLAARAGDPSPRRRFAAVRVVTRVTLSGIATTGLSTAILASGLNLVRGTWPDAMVAAAITVLLTAIGVAVTIGGHRASAVEWRWPGYAVLGAAGVQLVAEDLRIAGPALLFAVLAVYGTALTIVSRLARRDRDSIQP